ncbi:MAG: DUF4870 domain-containing protein [Bacteroidales bacterium]|nr:DUF4870 domain-containing protein [Bacteroidales bacterium]
MNQITTEKSDENKWAMFCHLSAFAGLVFPFGNIIGPLIIWSLKKDEYPFVDDQGKESINFQISMTIYVIISFLLAFILIGFLVSIAVGVFYIIMIVMASIKTYEGLFFRYPFSIKFIR